MRRGHNIVPAQFALRIARYSRSRCFGTYWRKDPGRRILLNTVRSSEERLSVISIRSWLTSCGPWKIPRSFFAIQSIVFCAAFDHRTLHCLLFRPCNPVLEVPAALSIGHFSQGSTRRSAIEVDPLGLEPIPRTVDDTVEYGLPLAIRWTLGLGLRSIPAIS